MNIKKIGLTALAGSLVATSAFAGSMSVSGGASFEVQHVNGGAANAGKAYSMGNSVTFTGSGELDNGLSITYSVELDRDAGTGTNNPFDAHSVKVASDDFGTLTFSGHAGSSAQSAVDDMASGDIWDNGFSATGAPTSSTSDNSIGYALPSLMDGLAVNVSYVPHTSTQYEGTFDWAVAYTGFEGLTVGYASSDNQAGVNLDNDKSTVYAKYAVGGFTIGYQMSENDHDTKTSSQSSSSYGITYAVNDDLSVSVDRSTSDRDTQANDEETTSYQVSYTVGSMKVKAHLTKADNVGYSSTATDENKALAVSFSF